MSRALIIAYTHYSRDGRVRRHAEALADRGDLVDVISLDHSESGHFRGVNVIGLKLARYRGSSRTRYIRSYCEFFARAAVMALKSNWSHPYDIAIVCTMPDAAILSALPLRLFGTRLVLDIHDTMPELYRDKFGGRRGALGARLLMWEERVCASLADRVLAVHALHAERLALARIPRRKISVVTNSPDPSIFHRDEERSSVRPLSVICHGTVTNRLGLDIAICAVARLLPRLKGINLLIVGEGDHLDEIKALASRLDLGEAVHFMPPVAIDLLPSVLREAAVGLVPNRATEATHLMLPVKLLEYMNLGIPVVCARLKTVEYYFSDDTIQYFEADNAEALANALEALLRDPKRLRELSHRGKLVAESFAWEKERDSLYAAIDSVFARSTVPVDARVKGGPVQVIRPSKTKSETV